MSQHLLNKKNMAKSCKIGVTAFDIWGIEPVQRAGREALYDVASVLRNRLDNELGKLISQGDDVDDAELLRARIRLTNAQADAQELKNARESGEVIDTAFCTFVLSRIAGEIASIMDSIPLSVSRRFPELENRHIDFIRQNVIKAMNKAAGLDEIIPDLLTEYNERNS
ncbi:TPA: terminase small subunit [Enterobacter hormaechei]|nr:terminase small subunit [Enterobacter hormaechei]